MLFVSVYTGPKWEIEGSGILETKSKSISMNIHPIKQICKYLNFDSRILSHKFQCLTLICSWPSKSFYKSVLINFNLKLVTERINIWSKTIVVAIATLNLPNLYLVFLTAKDVSLKAMRLPYVLTGAHTWEGSNKGHSL